MKRSMKPKSTRKRACRGQRRPGRAITPPSREQKSLRGCFWREDLLIWRAPTLVRIFHQAVSPPNTKSENRR
jgi:hypothetical protein